jgi:hypothetical protein
MKIKLEETILVFVAVAKNIKSVVCNEKKNDIEKDNKGWEKTLYRRKILGYVSLRQNYHNKNKKNYNTTMDECCTFDSCFISFI